MTEDRLKLYSFAGGDDGGVADHGDQVTLATHLARSTQKPLSALWNVTRSTNPASASVDEVWANAAAVICSVCLAFTVDRKHQLASLSSSSAMAAIRPQLGPCHKQRRAEFYRNQR